MKIMDVVKKIQKYETEIEELTEIKEGIRSNRKLTIPTRNQLERAYDLQIEITLDKMNHLIEQLETLQPEEPIEELHRQDLIPKAYNIRYVSETNPTVTVTMVAIEHSKKDALNFAESHMPSGYVVEDIKEKRNGLIYNGYEESQKQQEGSI